jgi:parvulin-like peptidyl-prolyl isomerase
VNGVPIKASDVEASLWEWRGPEVTEDLISLLLVRQQAAAAGVIVTEAEIVAKLQENLKLAETQKKGNPQDPNPGVTAAVALAQQGYPTARLYVRSEIEVTIDKIALKRFKPEGYVKVSTMIFLTTTGTAAEIASAAKKAQTAYERLKKGENWDKVLQTSGADPRMAKTHGILGWRSISAFPDTLQKTLPTLKPGAYTEPRQLPAGFQIFRLEQQGSKAVAADLTELQNQFVARERQTIVASLRSSAKIERFPPKEPGQ